MHLLKQHLKDRMVLISMPSSGSTRMRSLAYRMPTMLSLLSLYTGMRVNPAQERSSQQQQRQLH